MRTVGLLAELILWTLIAFIAGVVLVYGQSRLGISPATDPDGAQAHPQADSRLRAGMRIGQ
jgi:hypothetical protein